MNAVWHCFIEELIHLYDHLKTAVVLLTGVYYFVHTVYINEGRRRNNRNTRLYKTIQFTAAAQIITQLLLCFLVERLQNDEDHMFGIAVL